MRGAAALLSLALAILVASAPVSNAWHEFTVQHVRCAEHGELTHVATTTLDATLGFISDVAILLAQERDSGATEGHDHCALGCAVRSRASSPVVRTTLRYVAPVAVARVTHGLAPCPGRAFVLASAPKTSPPSV